MARNYCEDERVISAFLTNFRMVDVIRATGLSKKTCYKIRNDPNFQQVIRERKEAILKTAVNTMQTYMVKNVETLQRIIDDPETPIPTKVNALNTYMSHLRDWTTTTDLQKELEALRNTSGNGSTPF